MNIRKTAFILMTMAAFAVSAPAFAATSSITTTSHSTGGNGSNGSVGDNPDATAIDANNVTGACYVRDTTHGAPRSVQVPCANSTPESLKSNDPSNSTN